MNPNKKIILLIVLLFGIIVPFIPSVTVIEVFFLLIPFAIIFVVTFIYLIVCLLNEKMNSSKAIYAFSILPIFIASQLISGFSVDKIQRLRSNQIIAELEQIKLRTGVLPEKHDLVAGIEYIRMKDNKHFVITYSRGFMVTEKYDSEIMTWESYGWND
jgi:hypothetical protein